MRSRERYRVNEMFYSLQGEGMRAGTANVFVRFTGCNLACNRMQHGFDCDTDFEHGDWMTADDIYRCASYLAPRGDAVIFTGGEPALQLDEGLVDYFHSRGWYTAIETNGTREIPPNLDWVCVSPKPPDDQLAVTEADEVKYVIAANDPLPSVPQALLDANPTLLVSPAHAQALLDTDALEWCIKLVKENPEWRLSVQQHKAWSIR